MKILNKYCCHCKAEIFDKGFKSNVRSRPTIIVNARNKSYACKEAENKFIREYLDDTVELNSFFVEVIKKI
jgi:hypothetical protein